MTFFSFPKGENLFESVGPNNVKTGIPDEAIKWPQPVSFEIPAKQDLEISIVFNGSLLTTTIILFLENSFFKLLSKFLS